MLKYLTYFNENSKASSSIDDNNFHIPQNIWILTFYSSMMSSLQKSLRKENSIVNIEPLMKAISIFTTSFQYPEAILKFNELNVILSNHSVKDLLTILQYANGNTNGEGKDSNIPHERISNDCNVLVIVIDSIKDLLESDYHQFNVKEKTITTQSFLEIEGEHATVTNSHDSVAEEPILLRGKYEILYGEYSDQNNLHDSLPGNPTNEVDVNPRVKDEKQVMNKEVKQSNFLRLLREIAKWSEHKESNGSKRVVFVCVGWKNGVNLQIGSKDEVVDIRVESLLSTDVNTSKGIIQLITKSIHEIARDWHLEVLPESGLRSLAIVKDKISNTWDILFKPITLSTSVNSQALDVESSSGFSLIYGPEVINLSTTSAHIQTSVIGHGEVTCDVFEVPGNINYNEMKVLLNSNSLLDFEDKFQKCSSQTIICRKNQDVVFYFETLQSSSHYVAMINGPFTNNEVDSSYFTMFKTFSNKYNDLDSSRCLLSFEKSSLFSEMTDVQLSNLIEKNNVLMNRPLYLCNMSPSSRLTFTKQLSCICPMITNRLHPSTHLHISFDVSCCKIMLSNSKDALSELIDYFNYLKHIKEITLLIIISTHSLLPIRQESRATDINTYIRLYTTILRWGEEVGGHCVVMSSNIFAKEVQCYKITSLDVIGDIIHILLPSNLVNVNTDDRSLIENTLGDTLQLKAIPMDDWIKSNVVIASPCTITLTKDMLVNDTSPPIFDINVLFGKISLLSNPSPTLLIKRHYDKYDDISIVTGPMVQSSTQTTARVALQLNNDMDKCTCQLHYITNLEDQSKAKLSYEKREVTCEFVKSKRTIVFEFTGLTPGKLYYYSFPELSRSFQKDHHPVTVGRFRTLPQSTRMIDIVFLTDADWNNPTTLTFDGFVSAYQLFNKYAEMVEANTSKRYVIQHIRETLLRNRHDVFHSWSHKESSKTLVSSINSFSALKNYNICSLFFIGSFSIFGRMFLRLSELLLPIAKSIFHSIALG